MNVSATRSIFGEARTLGFALREEGARESAGSILVSGVLAEQLAKELAAGAEPSAVVTGAGRLTDDVEVVVHVVAGDPTEADETLVADAGRRGIETVVVELWPQEDWTRPFVLSPFVIECRPGEGFPVAEIADAIATATGANESLAARVPLVADAVRTRLLKQSVIRAAIIGLAGSRFGASRPLLTLEQTRLAARLRAVSGGSTSSSEDLPMLAGTAAAVLGSGFACKRVARGARAYLPTPVAYAAVAAAGTWALAKALDAAQSRLSSS